MTESQFKTALRIKDDLLERFRLEAIHLEMALQKARQTIDEKDAKIRELEDQVLRLLLAAKPAKRKGRAA